MTEIEKTVKVTKFFFVDNCKHYDAIEFDRKRTVNIYRPLIVL